MITEPMSRPAVVNGRCRIRPSSSPTTAHQNAVPTVVMFRPGCPVQGRRYHRSIEVVMSASVIQRLRRITSGSWKRARRVDISTRAWAGVRACPADVEVIQVKGPGVGCRPHGEPDRPSASDQSDADHRWRRARVGPARRRHAPRVGWASGRPGDGGGFIGHVSFSGPTALGCLVVDGRGRCRRGRGLAVGDGLDARVGR